MTPVQWTPKPSQPAPPLETGVWGWLYKNLFSSLFNSVLTVIGIIVIFWTVPPFIEWAVVDATWIGDSRVSCDKLAAQGDPGACWVFVKVRFELFLYGFYPEPERWRVNLTGLLLLFSGLPILLSGMIRTEQGRTILQAAGVLLIGLFFGWGPGALAVFMLFSPFVLSRSSLKSVLDERGLSVQLPAALIPGAGIYGIGLVFLDSDAALWLGGMGAVILSPLFFWGKASEMIWRWVFLLLAFPTAAFFILLGGAFGLVYVETHLWGGLFLTLVVAGTGIAASLPLGILLALGRRSEMPVIKTVCITFIEIIRGVPLVSVLFMASVMFPLFLPENVSFDKLLRALVGISLFYAAYVAEVIRGGLQALPKGQYEAAAALGWGYWKMMWIIIIPQALRLVIPGIVVNFLSLVKDTTLVAVIGLMDLLGIVKAAMADPEWIGYTKEAYVFAAVLFWIICFSISRYSMHLERKYHVSFR